MLYLVSTPIGNLQDISLRALSVLKSCDYILCEDTRHSLKLLQFFEIQKPLVSFHEWNEDKKQERVLKDLESGKKLCLISDAGTPLLADPGFHLVRECRKRSLPVSPIPGASALLAALVASGIAPLPFQFVGFLPRKPQELKEVIENILAYEGTTICYESPQRIENTLKTLSQEEPHRELSLARELTKKYETFLFGQASKLYELIEKEPPLGEIVLVIAPAKEAPSPPHFSEDFLRNAVIDIQNTRKCRQKEAIAIVASLLHLPKKVVYKTCT
jgi:16S rRNA (cytidine1402-2'-O)-methyltransferase